MRGDIGGGELRSAAPFGVGVGVVGVVGLLVLVGDCGGGAKQ